MPRNDNRIYLGGKPSSPDKAWWALTPEAKRKLMELRAAGEVSMGATGSRAPYWWSQEYGNDAAWIEAKEFVRSALRMWYVQRDMIIARYLRG